MKISFCLSTYNKKELLEITLQNYFEKKKENYELVISDGFSTDGTIEFLKELRDRQMVDALILSEKRDRGEWEGYKTTLNHVSGDYIYFLSDDDYFDFDSIDRVFAYLKENTAVDYLIADGFDLKPDGSSEHLCYHAIIRAANSMKPAKNRLVDGACGLGIFIKTSMISKLDLFTPQYGKRTDKGVTLALMNSPYIGASTNVTTYVAIKNEKSNSYIYNYNYSYLEKQDALAEDPGKDFLADVRSFKAKFNMAQKFRINQREEFLAYHGD